MRKIIIGIIIIVLFFPIVLNAQEKIVSVRGRPKSSKILKEEIGALTYMLPEDVKIGYLKVKGLDFPLSVISGKNHDLEGKVIGEGTAGVVFNKAKIRIRRVKVEGNPPKQKSPYISLKRDVLEVLQKYADITITKDTTYNGGSIGSFDDPKIVVVDKAKLTLKGDFKGYGVLILTGEPTKTKKVDPQRLLMEDNAKWYGIIISDVKYIRIDLRGKKSLVPIQPLKVKKEFEKIKKFKKPIPPPKPPKLPKPTIHRVQIFGALLFESKIVYIRMKLADIFYSEKVIKDLICKKIIENEEKIKEVIPLEWEEYKEQKK